MDSTITLAAVHCRSHGCRRMLVFSFSSWFSVLWRRCFSERASFVVGRDRKYWRQDGKRQVLVASVLCGTSANFGTFVPLSGTKPASANGESFDTLKVLCRSFFMRFFFT